MAAPRLLLMFVVAAFSIGCAGGLRDTTFLHDYESFNAKDGRNFGFRLVSEPEDDSVDQYFLTKKQLRKLEKKGEAPPSLIADGIDPDAIQPVMFIVARPEWLTDKQLSNDDEHNDVMFTVRERMYRYLLREYAHPVAVRYAWYPGDTRADEYRILEIRTAVTDVKRGSGWIRYLVGYGAGSAVIQIEGQIVDVTDSAPGYEGEVVAEFAKRVAHGAYPNGYMNPRVINDEYALRYAAELAVRRIAPVVRASIPSGQLRDGDPGSSATASR